MNLQCPNCQKLLTVAEQYAGQLMKCPLCNGTFTVPSLPSAHDPLPSPLTPPMPSTASSTPSGSDVYPFKDPVPAPPSAGPWPSTPTPPPTHSTELPEHITTHSMPLGDHSRTMGITLSPLVFQWIPSVALILVFFLLFTNWVEMRAGSDCVSYQYGFITAFGGNPVLSEVDEDPNLPVAKDEAGGSVLMGFFLILYFFVLVGTVGFLVLDVIQIDVPQLKSVWSWRWGIVAAANIFLFLFLGLQSLMNFGLETHVAEKCSQLEQAKEKALKEQPPSKKQKKIIAVETRLAQSAVVRTIWWRLTFWISLIGAVSAAIMYRLDQRRHLNLPLPRVEMRW